MCSGLCLPLCHWIYQGMDNENANHRVKDDTSISFVGFRRFEAAKGVTRPSKLWIPLTASLILKTELASGYRRQKECVSSCRCNALPGIGAACPNAWTLFVELQNAPQERCRVVRERAWRKAVLAGLQKGGAVRDRWVWLPGLGNWHQGVLRRCIKQIDTQQEWRGSGKSYLKAYACLETYYCLSADM